MANGYDAHSLGATGLTEASSSSAPMVALRDKRYTKSGIGFRTQEASEAGPTPPPIMFTGDYPGGTAARVRGQVDESKLPWETAQEATTPQIRPREALPPSRMDEALPPWLRGKGEDEEKEALPPWLKKEGDDEDEEKESAQPDMEEAPLTADKRNELPDSAFALPGRKYPVDTPERARSALSRVDQFGSDSDKSKVRSAVKKRYPKMKVD